VLATNAFWRVSHSFPASAEANTSDRLSRMRVYRLATQLVPESWRDAEKLRQDAVTERSAGQLYAAVGSIQSNLGEGYSRSSGRDRAHIFEYALGSVREAIVWYQLAEPVLGSETVRERFATLEEMRRMLLAIIPRERGRLIRPSKK
jgi:four helix bundle protein